MSEETKAPSNEVEEPSSDLGKEPSSEGGREPSSEGGREPSSDLGKEPSPEQAPSDDVAHVQDDDLVVDDHDDIEAEHDTEDAAEKMAAEMSDEERLARIQSLKPIIEGAVMAAGDVISLGRLQSIFDEHEIPSKGLLTEVLQQIQGDCDGRGFQLIEVASGWRFQVREEFATWVNRLWEEKPQKYSRALLETLALIAYRQPLTRGDIEEVRGVAVSSHIIKTLTEREWVKVVGHRDVPGRPALYATTKIFLDYFNLKSLDELPTLGELRDIESLNASLELDEQLPPEMIAEMKAEEAASEKGESDASADAEAAPEESEAVDTAAEEGSEESESTEDESTEDESTEDESAEDESAEDESAEDTSADYKDPVPVASDDEFEDVAETAEIEESEEADTGAEHNPEDETRHV